jgi:hypothetical protein
VHALFVAEIQAYRQESFVESDNLQTIVSRMLVFHLEAFFAP